MLQEKSMSKIYGELALLLAVCINSLGVVLMLYSGAGISAISSVPFAFSEVLPHLSLGNMDVFISRLANSQPDDFTKAICSAVLMQLFSWLCIQRIVGCT